MSERRGVYRLLVGKPKGKRPLGRSRSICKNNIEVDLQVVGWRLWAGLHWLRIDTGGGHL
jgi:hypothetical protein